MAKPWPAFESDESDPENLLLKPPPKKTDEDELAEAWKALNPEVDEDLPCLPPEKLREIVVGILDGSLFVSEQVKDQSLLGHVFLPFLFGGLKHFSQRQVGQIGVLYGPMSSALPRSINGYPMLTEASVLNKTDWARVRLAVRREQERRQDIKV